MTLDPGWDLGEVVVVGGGPAGSTTAGLLAAAGWRVSLIDRAVFPRPKPCGECLNPGAVAALRQLDLLSVVEPLDPVELRGWSLRTNGSRAEARFGQGESGLALRRLDLDHALLEEARHRGARLGLGVRVETVLPARRHEPPALTARRPDGTRVELRPRLVVGADGLRSVVARAVGSVSRRPRLRKVSLTCHVQGPSDAGLGVLELDGSGTLGLAPLRRRDGIWNATVVVRSDRFGRALAHDATGVFLDRLCRSSVPWVRDARLVGGPWTSGPFDWPVGHASAPGILLVGDAAGYFDPLTGQGIYRALRTAELAARAADRLLSGAVTPAQALRWYQQQVDTAIRPGRRLQRVVESVISRRRPRTAAIRLLRRRPRLANGLIRVTGDVAPVRSLMNPRLWRADNSPRTS